MPNSFFNNSPLKAVTPLIYSMGLFNMVEMELMKVVCTNIFQVREKSCDKLYRIQDTGYRIQDTGYRIQDTRYWILDTGYRILDTRYWILYPKLPSCFILETSWFVKVPFSRMCSCRRCIEFGCFTKFFRNLCFSY